MSETIKINNEVLEYNKIIYVDAINGDDTSGDGSKDNPYATIQKAVSVLDTDKTAIKLTGGQTYNEHASRVVGTYYNRENALFNLTANVDYDVIGDPENPPTVKLVSFGSGSHNYFLTLSGNNITKAHTINFYDLILVPEVPGHGCLSDLSASYTHTVTFNNVVFDHNAQGLNFAYLNGGMFSTANGITYNINNSIINATRFAYANIGRCYVNLANSLILCEKPIYNHSHKELTLTLDTCWVYPDTSENYWTGTWEVKDPQLDSQYNITVDGWQDVGTGTDPDGSVADIGVYGGPYAWGEWKIDSHLIQDKNNILTFDLINKTWIPLVPSQKNFKNHGITDLSNLIINTSKAINFKSKLRSGQVFKEPINFKAYKTITNIRVM